MTDLPGHSPPADGTLSPSVAREEKPPHECEKAAAALGFDLTRQFLTIAISGIAFIVGLALSTPGAVSASLLWWVLSLFGASAVFGMLFLMHGVSRLSEDRSFDIYATWLRIFAVLQIVLVVVGVALLCPVIANRSVTKKDQLAPNIEVKRGDAEIIRYPTDPTKNYEISIDKDRVRIIATDAKKS